MSELIPYLRLYKKHWFSLSLGMILSLATLTASIGLLTISGWFLSAAAVAGLTVARLIFNYMLPSGAVRGFALMRTAGRWSERVVSHDATFKLLTDLRIFFFTKLIPLLPGSVSNLRDADLLNRLVADVDAMDHVYLRLISPISVGILGTMALTILLCWFDMALGLLVGGILIAVLIIWPILFYKLGQRNGKALTEHKALLRVTTLDWLQGYSELVLFGAEQRYQHAILNAQQCLLKNQLNNAKLTGLASALLILINGISLVLILWLAADGVGGHKPDPLIALMVFATMASVELLTPIANAFQYLGQTLTSAKRLNEIILTKPDVIFTPHLNETSAPYDVDINNVTFYYPNAVINESEHKAHSDTSSIPKKALNNITLSIKAGHKVAIVGKTGSGKSTLLQLLSRYWDPQQGRIKIAGLELTQWNEMQLRASISVVSQRVDILNGTLRDNLLLAKPDANDVDLINVLTQVGLEGLLNAVDLGLDNWLGDGGRQLSGGEKRRIGIARALLHNAPIVLLDEPTEGLDQQTEQQIMQLFESYFTNKTVIFVTHRLVGLASMNFICLMEQGEIIEQGDHLQLLAQKGRYFQLHQKL